MNPSKNYKIKCINEDFQVTEVSLMPQLALKKPYKFTYIWLQKSGFTTFDALEQLKKFFKLTFDDINNQGLKDEDAITEQLISVKKILTNKNIESFNKKHIFKDKFSKIKHITGYGNEPVKVRALHGNSFRIVIRNLKENKANNLLNYLEQNRYHCFINYYDNQRFGMPGGPYNTHLIGKAIIDGDWNEAYKQMKRTENVNTEFIANAKDITSSKDIFKKINPKKISFFISSYNSFLWNAQASRVVNKYTKSKSYLLKNVGNLNFPIDSLFKCPQICEVKGYEFITEEFSTKPRISKRNLMVATTIYAHDLEKDELHKNMKKLTISFFLPTGSYATMIIKQIFLRLIK